MKASKQSWQALDHHLYIWLQRLQAQVLHAGVSVSERKVQFLLCVSGGGDSLAMLKNFHSVCSAEQLGVFHFHHGKDSNSTYRDQAQQHVQDLCIKLKLRYFYANADADADADAYAAAEDEAGAGAGAGAGARIGKAATKNSEASLRKSRYRAAKRILVEQGFDYLVTAHHQQDLLETRFLRLLRGTGAQGLKAMNEISANIFRPYLRVPQEELLGYAAEWVWQPQPADPTNRNTNYSLRNWLRFQLFPRLEQRRPGSVRAFAKSIDSLVSQLETSDRDVRFFDQIKSTESGAVEISLRDFHSWSRSQQRQCLAQIFLGLGSQNYTQGQVEEILKRLSRPASHSEFCVGQVSWVVNAGQLLASRRVQKTKTT